MSCAAKTIAGSGSNSTEQPALTYDNRLHFIQWHHRSLRCGLSVGHPKLEPERIRRHVLVALAAQDGRTG
jgi:hypothetical protein